MPAARPASRHRRKVDDYSDDYSDYYSDEYTRSGRTRSASSRTFSIGDLSRSPSRSPGRSDRTRRNQKAHGRPRSVADSEDYHELKDYLDHGPAPDTAGLPAPSAPSARAGAPRQKGASKSRRRSPEVKPRKRKRVELVPNKNQDTVKADGTTEVQRVRLECRKAKELARKAQAECQVAKEESRKALEESRQAKEESERIKEQIRAWQHQHWEEDETWDQGWECDWPRPDEVKWSRSHPKATLISAEKTRTHGEKAWWQGGASWASHAKDWACRDPTGAKARPTNADVRKAAQSGTTGSSTAETGNAKEMRMLVKNIKTTKLRREFQKRVGGQFGSYKKNRDERRAGRASKQTTDPYSVLFAHLSRRVPEEYLKSLFQEIGPVDHFELWKGPDGQSVGRGKVTYTCTAHANSAVKQLSGWYVHGRTMRVCLWRPVSEEFGQPHKENKLPEKPCSVTFRNCNHVSTEGFLRWLFSKAGTVLCFALQRSDEGKSLGWGSCTFDCKDAAERAVQRFDGAWVDNRQIHLEVDLKPPKSFRPCVFFHNVSWTMTASDLKRKLQAFGTVEEFELRVKPNGRSLGMGTCRFSCSKEAKEAIKGLNEHMVNGRRLYLCRYDPIGAGRVQASRPWENCPPEVKEEVVSDDEKEEKSNPIPN